MAEQAEADLAAQIKDVQQKIKAIANKNSQQNRGGTGLDADNFQRPGRMSPEDRTALTELHQQHEALSKAIQERVTASLAASQAASQQIVINAIENLGGTVEYTTTAGNAVVAKVPAGNLDALAQIPGIFQVSEDKKMEQHLDNADDALLMQTTKTGGGLWDNNHTGGIYDPAVVDSGTDLAHPFLNSGTSRENHWSWYLVAGAADPAYRDVTSGTETQWVDDLQGHGTHVMGIVASEGSTAYPNYLGMAYGIDKALHLKAGWLNSAGRASMYWSDKMWLVDRALNRTDQLYPTYGVEEFFDDVDGFNLSYGGETTEDDPAGGRFWDAVVDDYPNTVFTVSAGNSGPSNANFNDPATAYNGITVANVDDQDTATRNDDTIRASSTRGPTASGRRKPDIAAPGTTIRSANNNWETEVDYADMSGTSMAAPMVLGVAMDLMDAGVLDEKEIKALLLNTAQKNEAGINFESDADGWSTTYGWGYLNAWSAYYHRGDVRQGTVTENNTAGDFKLYAGTLRDEGSAGEGRDRATLVWNRHAVYVDHDYPSTFYGLSDLDLYLFNQANNSLIDYDSNSLDNVHQVRVDAGAGVTNVVVKVNAFSSDFPHGGTTESYALATEEGFNEVPLPTSFQGVGAWPSNMQPGEERDFEFWLRNDSQLPSHNNQFDLVLPPGWVLVSGPDPYSAGSITGGGALSSHVTWRLRAPTLPSSYTISSRHTHYSYGEAYGPFSWNMGVTVADTIPPSPNPMTWAAEPYEISTSAIRMTATTATDPSGPVSYYFDFTSSPTGGAGGSDIGWTVDPTVTDTSLGTNHEYCYRVSARDSAAAPNATDYSSTSCDYTDIETPTGITFGAVTSSSIQAQSTNTPSGLTRGSSGIYINNVTAATNSGWKQDNNMWTSGSLSPNSQYVFRAMARNGDSDTTAWSPTATATTLAANPVAAPFTNITQTSIRANWTANGNPPGTEYFCENTTTSANSGWTTATYWNNTGLSNGVTYSYRVRARNSLGTGNDWVALGSATTAQPPRTLSVSRDGTGEGTVSSNPAGIDCGSDCNESYTHGTPVTLTAAAATGSTFSGWAGDCIGTSPTCNLTMDQNRTATATFTLETYLLTVNKSGKGDGIVTSNPIGIDCGSDCTEHYDFGTMVTLTAAPLGESKFKGWSGACSGVALTCDILIDEALTVDATFDTGFRWNLFLPTLLIRDGK